MVTRLLALTAAIALALAGYAAASGADEPCVTVMYTQPVAPSPVTGAGVIVTTIQPIPPGCE